MAQGPLSGVKIIEFAGIGPCPFGVKCRRGAGTASRGHAACFILPIWRFMIVFLQGKPPHWPRALSRVLTCIPEAQRNDRDRGLHCHEGRHEGRL